MASGNRPSVVLGPGMRDAMGICLQYRSSNLTMLSLGSCQGTRRSMAEPDRYPSTGTCSFLLFTTRVMIFQGISCGFGFSDKPGSAMCVRRWMTMPVWTLQLQVHKALFSYVDPTPTSTEPYIVAYSEEACNLLGLDPEECKRPEFALVMSGQAPLPGTYVQRVLVTASSECSSGLLQCCAWCP